MRIKYQFAADASGSVGGLVASRNQYGQYFRSKVVPVNPNTDRQQSARSRFTQMAGHWNSTLTDAERTAWNLYGSSVDFPGKFGDTIRLSGLSHFIRSNTALLQVGLSVVEAGPTTFTLPDADSTMVATISEATQLISVAFDTNLAWVGEDEAFMSVHMTSPQNASRDYLDIKLRYAGAIEGDATTPPTSPQTIAVPYVVVENQKVIVKCRIGRADGRLSSFFQSTVSVAA